MANEKDIRKLAAVLLVECGEDARLWALLRATKLQAEGDAEHAAMWYSIGNIIEELEAAEPLATGRRQH